jgi:acetyl-CoA synthetase (ADP-forming)
LNENDNLLPYKDHFLYNILNPKSIAVFGANNKLLETMGSMQLRNIIAGGGLDGNIFPIHPRLDMVQGIRAFKSVLNLPITPDLAFLILPTTVVPPVMEECGQKGIKNLLITSGGFREVGGEGIKLSQKIDSIAKKYKMRFIGPNCLGIFNGWYGFPEIKNAYFNTLWVYKTPERGNISIVSQSGTIATQLSWYANDLGVKIGKAISVGNEANIDIVDFLSYFQKDPQTKVIGLYIEEIKRGKEFLKLAKEIVPYKPIIAIYAGGTEASTRSIMSHTGSIAGNQKIFDSVFKETGIIATDSIMDFLYFLRTFSFAKKYNIYPKGKNVAIISDSGGAGSMMTKSLELNGLKVPEFSKELKLKFLEKIPSTASANNPIDVTFHEDFFALIYKFPEMLVKSGEIDSIIVYGIYDFDEIIELVENSGMKVDDSLKQLKTIIPTTVLKPIKRLMQKYSIPVFYVGPLPYRSLWNKMIIDSEIPLFSMWDQPPKCLAALTNYSLVYKNKE